MNRAVAEAYVRFTEAGRRLHADIAAIYPVGTRVRLARGNHVRLGTVTEVSCHFVRIQFDGGRKPVWKKVHNETVDPA